MKQGKKYAETYGGMIGAIMPLIVMIGAMLLMVAFGMRSTKNFWSAGYLAVMAGFLLYKDKKEFQSALIDQGRSGQYFCIYDRVLPFCGRYVKDSVGFTSRRCSPVCAGKDQSVTGTYADPLLLYVRYPFQRNGKCGRCNECGRTGYDTAGCRHGLQCESDLRCHSCRKLLW